MTQCHLICPLNAEVKMEYVIIGNGVAGVHAAESIRQLDPDGPITMVGDETETPYCRPMISMVLEGAVPPEKLPIRPDDFYRKLNITPVLGQRAAALDANNRAVTLADGRTIPFDRLLIASGADPRPIKAGGLDKKNVLFMRTQDHVRRMLDLLPRCKNALVLGGGLVGFKAACGFMARGLDVTMLIRSGYPLSMQVDETAGKLILDELVRHGLEVKAGVEVEEFEGGEFAKSARLSDGSVAPCDITAVGKGVLPALSFLPKDQVEVDLGVLVDARLETSAPGIYAAGDAAEALDVARKTPWVNAIWPEAASQGRIAGMNMAGRPVTYKGSLSRNVIRIFGMDVMTAGLVNPPADGGYEVVTRTEPRRNTYRKLVFKDDRLVGMTLVNRIEQGGALMAMIQSESPVRCPKEALLAEGLNYRTLIS